MLLDYRELIADPTIYRLVWNPAWQVRNLHNVHVQTPSIMATSREYATKMVVSTYEVKEILVVQQF